MTPTATPTDADVREMAEHHERQGLFHARQAMSNATWYHGEDADTRRAAEHFTVAAALRRHLMEKDNG